MDLVDDHAAEGQLRLDQLAVEVDRLVDRLPLRPADDQEAGVGVGEQAVDALGAGLEAVDHAAEGVEELGQVGEQVEADDLLQHPSATEAPRPATFAASPVGFMKTRSERPSMNWVRRFGASRKSSALRVGGVSRTSRS